MTTQGMSYLHPTVVPINETTSLVCGRLWASIDFFLTALLAASIWQLVR